jgi:hypothetical protein
MSTIEELKAIPKVLDNLRNEYIILSNKINSYTRIFINIIKDSGIYDKGWEHICNLNITVDKVTFNVEDDEGRDDEKHYEFPLELFVSAETFRNHIQAQKDKEEQERLEKEKLEREKEEKKKLELERKTYEKLKKKFEEEPK